MAREELLDLRNLEPPEPFDALERNGFAYSEATGKDSLIEIAIWRRE